RYVVPRARGSAFPWKLTALEMPAFAADPAATSVTANADLQLSTCYRATASCIYAVDRFGGMTGSKAMVDSRLEVIQLDANGFAAGCGARTQWPAAGSGSSPDRNYMRSTITRDVHHMKFRYQLRMPISSAEGCTRTFLIRVVVRSVAGDPVKIAGSRLNSRGGVRLAFSNGFARNAF
ncbi:MAG TPA: hypothetical protein VM600_01165, partial [Actinomycetota bacterium]|nr:hypothetical protein [Actinomycetota bacterium]